MYPSVLFIHTYVFIYSAYVYIYIYLIICVYVYICSVYTSNDTSNRSIIARFDCSLASLYLKPTFSLYFEEFHVYLATTT